MRMVVRKRQHRAPPSDRTDRSVPPSVFLPENVIPSADAQHLLQERRVSFQSLCHCAVRLPESFRGGCSFGAGSGPVSPAAMRTLNHHLLCTEAHRSTALYSICHPLFRRMRTSNCFRPLRGQKRSVGQPRPQQRTVRKAKHKILTSSCFVGHCEICHMPPN